MELVTAWQCLHHLSSLKMVNANCTVCIFSLFCFFIFKCCIWIYYLSNFIRWELFFPVFIFVLLLRYIILLMEVVVRWIMILRWIRKVLLILVWNAPRMKGISSEVHLDIMLHHSWQLTHHRWYVIKYMIYVNTRHALIVSDKSITSSEIKLEIRLLSRSLRVLKKLMLLLVTWKSGTTSSFYKLTLE